MPDAIHPLPLTPAAMADAAAALLPNALRVRRGVRAAPLPEPGPPCPMCGNGAPPQVLASSRCAGCDSPLAPPLDPLSLDRQGPGRRGALRCERDHLAQLHVGWPSAAMAVRWRDLSLTGLSVLAEAPVAPGQRVRVIDPGFDGVAQVLRCEPEGRYFALHGRLITAQFMQAHGVFVRVKA